MIDPSAIDSVFLTRLFFAMAVYWITGVINKGIAEKIQAHYGGLLFSFSNKKLQELKRYASQSCTQIDDLFLNPVADLSQQLDPIINRCDLSPPDQQLYRQFLDEDYRVSVLLKKLNLKS